MRSPYTVLGVDRSAKAEDIKSAYRLLAKTWHPDQNRDNPQAGNRFAEIALAYKLLIDPELRVKFDSGHIDAGGRRKKPGRGFAVNPFRAFRQAMGAGAGVDTDGDGAAPLDTASFEDMVAHIFGEAAAKQARDPAQAQENPDQRTKTDAPGMDQDPLDALDELFAKWKTRNYRSGPELPVFHHHLDISIEAAFAGYRGEVSFANGVAVAFAAPPGIIDGTEIRVPSPDPWSQGDAIVILRHKAHPRFRCSGPDLHGDHAIDLAEAVLGGSTVYQGLDGPLRIEIPEWSGSDTVLRISQKGLPTGHGERGALHVHLRVMLPDRPDQRLTELMRSSKKAWYV